MTLDELLAVVRASESSNGVPLAGWIGVAKRSWPN
jgi:hypothetical protein